MIIRNGYLARKTSGNHGRKTTNPKRMTGKNYRDWYIVKASTKGGVVPLGDNCSVYFPKELIGLKVKFKLEIVEEKTQK